MSEEKDPKIEELEDEVLAEDNDDDVAEDVAQTMTVTLVVETYISPNDLKEALALLLDDAIDQGDLTTVTSITVTQ